MRWMDVVREVPTLLHYIFVNKVIAELHLRLVDDIYSFILKYIGEELLGRREVTSIYLHVLAKPSNGCPCTGPTGYYGPAGGFSLETRANSLNRFLPTEQQSCNVLHMIQTRNLLIRNRVS